MMARACLLAVATVGLIPFAVADWDPIAGYTPVSDVIEHSELDLDMLDMEVGADNQTDAGFLATWKAYSEGGNRQVWERGQFSSHCYLSLWRHSEAHIITVPIGFPHNQPVES